MDVSYSEQLEFLVAQFEEKRPRYPIWHCDAAQFVLFKTLKLQPVNGIYVPDQECHSWNYDPNADVYVDITLHQFRDYHRSITFLPCSTHLLRRNSRLTFFKIETNTKSYTTRMEISLKHLRGLMGLIQKRKIQI